MKRFVIIIAVTYLIVQSIITLFFLYMLWIWRNTSPNDYKVLLLINVVMPGGISLIIAFFILYMNYMIQKFKEVKQRGNVKYLAHILKK